MSTFSNLIIELQLEIIHYLSPRDLAQLCCTSQNFHLSARRLLYRSTTGDFNALRRLGLEHVRAMSEETLSMVTTLAFQYNVDVMDAKEMLQKCSRVEYLDISEFLKNHEIARPGSSDISPFEDRNPSEVLEYLTKSCRESFSRLKTVRINLAPGKVLKYFLGHLDTVEHVKICYHYLMRHAVPGNLFEIISKTLGSKLKSLTLELPPFGHGFSDLQLLGSQEHFPKLQSVTWPLDFSDDSHDFQEIVQLCSTSHWKFHNSGTRGFVLHAESLQNYEAIPEGLAHYVPILDSFANAHPTTIDVNWASGFSGPTDPQQRLQDITRVKSLLVDQLPTYKHKRLLYQCEEPPTLAAAGSIDTFNELADVLTSLELRLFDKKFSPAQAPSEDSIAKAMAEIHRAWTSWLVNFLSRATNLSTFKNWNNGAAVFSYFRPVHLEIMHLASTLQTLCQEHSLRRLELDLSSLPHKVRAKPNFSAFDPRRYEYEVAGGEYVRSAVSSGVAQLLFLTGESGAMGNLEVLHLRELKIRTRGDREWLATLPAKLPKLREIKIEGKYYYSSEDEKEGGDSLFCESGRSGLDGGVLTGLRTARLTSRLANAWDGKCATDISGLVFVKTVAVRA
ncbi:hypothetical protein L873DRAFT_1802088 [Choiromyces venosus 120613-1]|uniref:F-box domain-containing protein n=1 Tax=Choiromyces venosus 120613-1 TaxID=1336337 RepID=A0A3N4JW89_9PEZI|nr:hypothetical protein L873DRAFT_1802088 [Choiromyces venosus 120613-1]